MPLTKIDKRHLTVITPDHVAHLWTISAYLTLPTSTQERVFRQIEQVLPETVELSTDVVVHLARRRPEQ
ncbi:hypothetical protein AB0C19_16485 [Micromonospora sp. NPDC048842]|uniref:hypothetical protein n=1 Tax=Micromonospora sp. NPDC048842 TaxID=3154346 RepID=UPI0033F68197